MVNIVTLENGLTCITEERPGTGLVSMQIHVKYGSQNESVDEAGLTFLAQESVNGGTKTLSREELADAIEARGASLATQSSRKTTIFSTKTLARDTSYSFALLADVVRNPAFDPAEIELTKTQIMEWIDQESQDPEGKTSDNFMQAVFPGQSLAHDPKGTKDLLASFTPEQVKRKYAEILANPANIVISFAGDIDNATAEKLVRQYFGDLPAAAVANQSAPSFSFEQGDVREAASNKQLNLILGFPAPSIYDTERYNLVMLNELYAGGMSAPLFQEIREKRGLVYSVHAAYNGFDTTGFYCIEASTGEGKAGELLSATIASLGDIVRKGFTQEELDNARIRAVRSLRSSLEKAGSAANRNALQLLTYGRVTTPETYEHNLRQVTPDHIRLAAASLLQSGKYAFAGVGPLDTLPTEKEILDMMAAQLKDVSLPVPAPQSFITESLATTTGANEAKTEPKITVLTNGMTIVTVENPGSVSCGAWVGVGSDNETLELNGATHMNEHMMFKGTPSYAAGTIDKIVEGKFGGGLNAYTSKDQTAYYFYNLQQDDLAAGIDILGEMVFKANIDEDEYAGKPAWADDGTLTRAPGERDVVIEEIGEYEDDVGSRKWNMLYATAYPGQSHGRTILGTEASLRATDSAALRAYRDKFYVANNVVFCAVGPIKHEDFVDLISKKYGAMPKLPFEPLPTPVYQGGVAYEEMELAKMCNIAFFTEGVSSNDPDLYVYKALSDILGGGSSSRLHKEIVNKLQLTASVGSGMQAYRHSGNFIIAGTAAAPKVKPLISAFYSELHKLVETVTLDELQKAKAGMEMGILSKLEANRNICDYYGRTTLAAGTLVTPADISAKINAVTIDDIKRIGQKILTGDPTVVAVVPPGMDKKFLPTQAEVIAYRDAAKKGQKPPASEPQQKPAVA